MWRLSKAVPFRTFQIMVGIVAIACALGSTNRLLSGHGAIIDDPATSGQWSGIYDLVGGGGIHIAAIHMHVLPNGKVLLWDRVEPSTATDTWLWDPTQPLPPAPNPPAHGTITNLQKIVNDRTVLFCSGHAFLPDGRLLVVGGGHAQNMHEAATNIFDFRTNTWAPAPPVGPPDMPAEPAGNDWPYNTGSEAGRWYPTAAPLANGEMLVAAGEADSWGGAGIRINQTPIVYTRSNTWRPLLIDVEGVEKKVPAAAPWEKWYPFLFAAPNGRVFRAGGSGFPGPNGYLNTDTGSWTPVTGARDVRSWPWYATAVMYEPGKILRGGGGNQPGTCRGDPRDQQVDAIATADTIDLNAATPSWTTSQQQANMLHPREYHNATILADGTVLVTGGEDINGPAMEPELWNPATRAWAPMAQMHVPRGYHSTAVLLPNGQVVSAGSRAGALGQCDQRNLEIFSPPYLFKGPQPVITSAPTEVAARQWLVISTPDTDATEVSWVRLSSVTHSFNANQRFVRSTVTPVAGGVALRAPSLNEAPPGHYLLFLLKNGVPSVATIVRIRVGPSVADFNGDGNSDFVWRHYTGPGENGLWLLNGTQVITNPYLTSQGNPFNTADTNWQIKATGDFNDDGKPDLIWQHATTGQIGIWWMDGSRFVGTGNFATLQNGGSGSPSYAPHPNGPYWNIVGAADLNRDGKLDLVWQDPQNGTVRIWHMNGLQQMDGGIGDGLHLSPDYVPLAHWHVVGVADMNKDGWPDLVWQDYSQEAPDRDNLAAWFLTDSTVTETKWLSPPRLADTSWRIVGVADIMEDQVGGVKAGDDNPDLIWQNELTGQVGVWYMDGIALKNVPPYYTFPQPWVAAPPWRLIVK